MNHPIVIRDENEHWDVMDPENIEDWYRDTMERRKREHQKEKMQRKHEHKKHDDNKPELALGA